VDGTAKTLSFNVTDTLQDVLTQLGTPTAKLMTTFPKRVFTNGDLGSTLKELGIKPSDIFFSYYNMTLLH
jgi:hypothetical protein